MPDRRSFLRTCFRTLAAAGASGVGGRPLRAQETGALPNRGGSLTYKDARLGGKIPPREWSLFVSRETQKDRDYGPAADPKFNVNYPGRLQVMCSTEEEGRGQERAFVIHFLRPEDETLARRVGGVMARLYWLGVDYLGVGPATGRYINVWLARHGEPGGEEYLKNIYLFAIDQARPAAEWVRELAHEYSHIFLPPVGEYTQPEKWANGYLGERLFLKWLLHDNPAAGVWSEPIDGAAYVANEVIPIRNAFLNAGPGAPVAAQRDDAGMKHFIGQVLAVEAAHGPQLLRPMLQKYLTRRPEALGSYLGAAIGELKPLQFTLDPGVFIPQGSQVEPAGTGLAATARIRKAAYWLFLPGGTWHITLQGAVPDATTAALEGAPLRRQAGATWETAMPGANGAWRRFEITAPGGQELGLQAIQITRKDVG
jgi:hypothetical protein